MREFALSILILSLTTLSLARGATLPTQEAKVICQYALTSANDFPQRDPQDWRLQASNDDGKSWVTLDVRKGEIFTERHQRRVFQIANRAPYKLYRLQVDRVRDPAATDSVQLAEIEPMGESGDSLAPLPEDLTTVQGENPPLETHSQAFDGRVETKWLDHADQAPATRATWIQWQYLDQSNLMVTNVQRLLALRSRAAEGHRVHLDGVIVGRLADTNVICLLDATGGLEITVAEADSPLSSGQRVIVEGTSRWTNGQVGLLPSRWQKLPPLAPAEPKRIVPEQPLAPGDDLAWVETEGRVQFCTSTSNHTAFELEDNERCLSVRVLHPEPVRHPPASGTLVRVRGLCGAALNGKGERVASILWLASLTDLVPVSTAEAPANSATVSSSTPPLPGKTSLLTSIEQVRRLSPEELARRPDAKVRGVVTELFGAFIQDGSAGVELWRNAALALPAPSFGTCVEVEGKADWAFGHGPIIRAEKIVTLGEGKLPQPEHCSWSQLASSRMMDQWVEIDGVVRSTDGSHLLLTCEGGQLMATIRSAPAPLIRELVDATVRIRGVSVAASDSRGQVQGIQLLVPSLEYLEVAQAPPEPFSLPTRRIGSLLQVRGPNEFIHRVKIEGVLTFREDRKCFVQDSTGGAMVIPQEEVVLNRPAGGWSWVFWQAPKSNAPSAPELELHPGDQLEVVGFPETRGYSPVLTEVLVRKVPRTSTVQPVKTTLEEIAGGSLDSTLVTLEADALRGQILGSHYVLELQSGQRAFQALLPVRPDAVPAIAPGSRVRVTGVCQIEPIPYAELGKSIASFKLLVSSPAALTILARPPWWTLKRALAATGALAVVLAFAGAWIGILRRQVEERTKQLQQEIAEHEKTEAQLASETRRVQAEIQERKRIEEEVEKGHKKLLQASRLAGMAEVATSVLHNVGNVLNSVNVLASSLADHVQRSKVPSVTRLAALLNEHQAELGRFLTEDARGQQVPGYLGRLGAHLTEEQARSLDRLKSLTESVQHIKEIVAMQQNYAKASGVLETVCLAEIVEDALRIHNGALARHEIHVVREFEPVPQVTIDRHKVLQILFNLLANAKYACDESGPGDKQIIVRIQRHGEDRIRISAIDNGVGIPPENLPRLFDQEFSTRKGGHGFGLHSSILAAQDMGASLTAHSDGPGKGAMFVLEFPFGENKSTAS